MKKYIPIIAALLIFSCGGDSNKTTNSSDDKLSYVKKDLSTTPEEGGYGFEIIAKELGYQTSNLSDDDYKYFGSSKATKGGHLKHIRSRFPATMRILGQHYNYAENIDIIIPLCYQILVSISL